MSCLHEAVNAKVVYGNTVAQVQYIYGIQYINPKSGSWLEGHKDWPACYTGYTHHAAGLSTMTVYALNNSGPFYEWWEWGKLLKQRGLITNFQAVIDKVWSMSEDKTQLAERVKDLKDAWVQLQLADNKVDAIHRLSGQVRPVYQEVLGYLEEN